MDFVFSTEGMENKKEIVTGMFNEISGKYDFLNHFLSLRLDIRWRKKTIRNLLESNPKQILDIATGTADMAILEDGILKPHKIIGIDISTGMLEKGKEKIKAKGLDNLIELIQGDSENLPFDSNKFDAVTVAFGVRNFENIQKGLQEMNRVLKKDGKAMILEFSLPENKYVKKVYRIYFNYILPRIGKFFSKSSFAYNYLPESVSKFPQGEEFTGIMLKAGFCKASYKTLSSGICTVYTGIK